MNEHEPVFSAAQYSTSITEDTGVGTSILRVTATDQDDGLQGEIVSEFKEVLKTVSAEKSSNKGSNKDTKKKTLVAC